MRRFLKPVQGNHLANKNEKRPSFEPSNATSASKTFKLVKTNAKSYNERSRREVVAANVDEIEYKYLLNDDVDYEAKPGSWSGSWRNGYPVNKRMCIKQVEDIYGPHCLTVGNHELFEREKDEKVFAGASRCQSGRIYAK